MWPSGSHCGSLSHGWHDQATHSHGHVKRWGKQTLWAAILLQSYTHPVTSSYIMTRNFFATWSCRQVLCPKLQVINYMVSARINSELDDSAPWPCFIFDQKLSWPFHLSLNLTQKHLLCPVITDVEDHKALFDNCPPAMVGQSCNVELYTWTAARFEMKNGTASFGWHVTCERRSAQ